MPNLGEYLARKDKDGFESLADRAYLIRPKSFVVCGSLTQFTNNVGAVHVDQFRSFELYRASLNEPEVITFDELWERARWIVENV